jgi:copper chaperone CopZ
VRRPLAILLGHLTFGTALLPAAPLLSGCAAPAADISTELRVGDMVCESCSQAITAALQKLDGVHEVHIDHVSGKAVIRHDPARCPRAELVAVITRLGYSVADP